MALLSDSPVVDIDRFFHGAAPELASDREHFDGLTNAGATKASDVYAFGVLAWEVSIDVWCFLNNSLNGALPLDFLWGGPVLRQAQDHGSRLHVEGLSPSPAYSPRGIESFVEGNSAMLEGRSRSTHENC